MNTYIKLVKRVYSPTPDGDVYSTIKQINFFRYTSQCAFEEKMFGYVELRRYRDPMNYSIIVVVVEEA